MDFPTADKILKGFNVPVQPSVVSRLLGVLPDLEKVTALIQQDPSLTGSVLKLVNAGQSAPSKKITSVEQAVSLLGSSGIIAMVNAQLLRKASIVGMQEDSLREFWKANNDVAFCCGLMARQLNISHVEQAYNLGLFHNIGMPVIWQKHPGYFSVIANPSENDLKAPLLAMENNAYNCSHASVGYYVARGMSLDPNVCEAVRLHHDVARLFESSRLNPVLITLLSLLKAAEYVMAEITTLHGRPTDEEWLLLKQPVLEELGVSELDFQDLEEIVRDEAMTREGL